MFRIGVILDLFYIMTNIILKEEIINYLGLISILYGVSSSAYWFLYNLFVINRIDNNYRTEYTVKSKIISSIIGVLCPILLGSLITVTNYELIAIIIFIFAPEKEGNLPDFNLKNT